MLCFLTNNGGCLVQFGLILPQYNVKFETTLKVALEAEGLGFSSVWLQDHFWPWPIEADKSCLECWTTLSALAVRTSKLKLGTLVTCASYRNPALVAKMGANVDQISNGRLELGVGAGNYEQEHNAFGYEFLTPRERVKRLEEFVKVVKLMWTEDAPTFKGKYYSIDAAICNPKPIQKPHPRIWIGGRGERLMQKVVAKMADGWNMGAASVEEYKEKALMLEKICRNVGRDPRSVIKSMNALVLLDLKKHRVNELKEWARSWKSARPIWQNYVSTSIAGTPEDVISGIEEYIRVGVEYFMLYFPKLYISDSPEFESVQLFAKEVMPCFGDSL
jgi:F420-dependent oxidoreductase-like protein